MPQLAALVTACSCFTVARASDSKLGDQPSAKLTYDSLTAQIRAQKITSVEQLLPLLPAEFRANYTLLYHSRSEQEASSTLPRVILFGEDASLTCTFNNGAETAGGDTLECFQFLPAERRFDFRQIRFPSPSNGLNAVAFSDANTSTDHKVSCSQCHALDLRPNWDGYREWPGAYGSADDEIGLDAPFYKSFVASRGKHPRYRWLIQDESDPLAPYSSGTEQIGKRPNMRFSDLIGRMNSLRAQRLMEARLPLWRQLSFALQALHCEFTDVQKFALSEKNPTYASDTDLNSIFAALQLRPNEWRTQIFRDTQSIQQPDYEQQSGFGFLTIGVAMSVAKTLAQKSDAKLSAGLQIVSNASKNVSSLDPDRDNSLRFFATLNSIVLEPNTFNPTELKIAQDSLCPELDALFVESYLKH